MKLYICKNNKFVNTIPEVRDVIIVDNELHVNYSSRIGYGEKFTFADLAKRFLVIKSKLPICVSYVSINGRGFEQTFENNDYMYNISFGSDKFVINGTIHSDFRTITIREKKSN